MEGTLLLSMLCLVYAKAMSQRLNVQKDSLLLHLDKIYDTQLTSSSINNTKRFVEECQERKYDFTVYYRVVYFRICGNSNTLNQTDYKSIKATHFEYTTFCENLSLYYEQDFKNLSTVINKQATSSRVYGAGLRSDERWLAHLACKHISHYYAAKDEVNSNVSKYQKHLDYPRFTEWFVQGVPFSLPVACGFTERTYNLDGDETTATDCLAPSYKWALYITIFIDGLILIGIVIANVTIITVLWRMKPKFVHGYYKLSLACADLLIGLVIIGSMNTSLTVYFGSHKFTESGYDISILDYHNQAYVNGFGSITVISLSVSVFTLVAISLDRFLAIIRPFKYRLNNQKIFCVLMVLIVLISLVLAFCPLFIPDISYHNTSLGLIIAPKFFVAYVVCLGGAVISVWILNIWIYLIVKFQNSHSLAVTQRRRSTFPNVTTQTFDVEGAKSQESSHSSSQLPTVSATIMGSPTITHIESRQCKYANKNCIIDDPVEVKLAVTVQMIVSAFTIALLPSIFVMFAGGSNTLEQSSENFDPVAKATWNAFSYLSSRLLFSNSFVNCIIYSYRSKAFRREAKSVFHNTTTRRKIGKTLRCKPLFKFKTLAL